MMHSMQIAEKNEDKSACITLEPNASQLLETQEVIKTHAIDIINYKLSLF